MEPIEYTAGRFEKIIAEVHEQGGRTDSLPEYDRIIFYLLSIRCEIDINGFDSVFEQLLTEGELLFSIDALDRINCKSVANALREAHTELNACGFFRDPVRSLDNYRLPDGTGMLDSIAERVSNAGGLWNIDTDLADLVPKEAKYPATRRSSGARRPKSR